MVKSTYGQFVLYIQQVVKRVSAIRSSIQQEKLLFLGFYLILLSLAQIFEKEFYF